MNQTRFYHSAAFAVLLLLLLAGSLIVQTAGYVLDLALSPYSLYIALLPALLITYGYCFPLNRRHVLVIFLAGMALALLGIASAHMLDFSADGLGYQQASVEAIMKGWNPFGPPAIMLWQQVYPSGIWAIEASLSWLYGSIEAAKMYHIWLIFIALPLLLFSLSRYKGALNRLQIVLAVLAVLSVTLISQLLTHYVDADAFLAGVIFISGVLLHGESRRFNIISALVMATSLCLIVNTKLTGVYHAFMLCSGAVLFIWLRTRRLPWKVILLLMFAGIFAVTALGYRPYVTSFVRYGPSLFPPDGLSYGPQLPMKHHWFLTTRDTELFSGQQRPSSFDDISPPERFFYSIFSTDGGIPHQPAQLKWPWTIGPDEWRFSGYTDSRTGGNGPLFALGLVTSLAVFAYAALSRKGIDKGLLVLAVIILLFSAIFPQGWWARYVPFAHLVPFLLLFAIKSFDKIIRAGFFIAIFIFGINVEMSASASFVQYYRSEQHFAEVVKELKEKPAGSVYIVPPLFNYKRYNGAYLPLQRRLKENGIATTIMFGVDCPRMAEMYSEFSICY